MTSYDATDLTILRLLQENAKININDLAKQLNLSKTPIYDRIRRMEKSGLIKKYVALADRKQVSPSVIVFLTGALDVQQFCQIEEFYAAVREIPEIMECYLMGGENDFHMKVMVRDLDAYNQFYSEKIASLPRVRQIKSSFVLNEVKSTTKLPF